MPRLFPSASSAPSAPSAPSRLRVAAFAWFGLLTLLAVMLLPTHAHAQEVVHTIEPRVLIDKDDALAAAATVTRDAFPDADTVYVRSARDIVYREDGTYTMWDEGYIKLLTEKGRRDFQTLSSHYTIPYQQPEDCQIPLVQIHRADGTVIDIDIPANSRTVTDRSSMGSNIYNPNDKIIQISIPGLEIGDTIRYIMYDNISHPRFRDAYFGFFLFEHTSPILRSEVTVTAPAAMPLQRIVKRDPVGDTVTFTETKEEDAIRYHWVARDVPQMFSEPNMPPLHTVVQRVMVSTLTDWKYVSKWYWNLSKPRLDASTPEIPAMVRELTEGVENRHEKINRLFQFVSQRIRYLGITKEDEAPGYEPHDVSDTFLNRAGVCRDKAALLVAMLQYAGFEAFPVLIHTGAKIDMDVPLPYFNHAITAVREPDGSYLLMDPTDESTKQLLPAYLDDKSFLVATPEGDTLRLSPVSPATDNLMRIETTASIDARGTLTGRSVLHFDGTNDNVYRTYFSRVSPELRRDFFDGVIKGTLPGGRLLTCDIQPEDIRDTTRPLVVTLTYDAQNVLVEGGDVAMLPLPYIGTRVGMVNFILGRTGLETRRYPFQTEIACGVRESLKINLDPVWGEIVSLPVFRPIENDTLTWRRSLAKVDASLMGTSQFKLHVVEFSPEQYATLKETLRQIEYNNRRMPILHTQAKEQEDAGQYLVDGADAIVLSSDIEYRVETPQTWTKTETVRKRILTYAGKKDNSEIHIDYNPLWEEVRIEYAKSVAPDQTRNEYSDEDVQIFDAAWVGAARVYPGSKTKVITLPGVQIGGTIEYRIHRTYREQPFFSTIEAFRGFDPILRKRVRVITPPDFPLRQKATAPVSVMKPEDILPDRDAAIVQTTQTTPSRTVHEWTAFEVERIRREDSLPPLAHFAPMLFLSSGDWEDYGRTVLETLAQSAATAPEAALDAFLDGIDTRLTPRESLTRIRDAVDRRIRLAGPSLDELPLASGVTTPARTLAEGYGNQADRAVLLYALLRRLGMEPAFVLSYPVPVVHNYDPPVREIPQRDTLSGVLVRVRLGDTWIHLGDTGQYDALGATNRDGTYGFDPATGAWATIRAPETFRDRQRTAYLIDLKANGNATLRRTLTTFGTRFGVRHKLFAEMPPEARARFQQEEVVGISQAARATEDLKTDFSGYPGTETLPVSVERLAVRDNQFLYLSLPESLRGLLRLRSDTRDAPFYIRSPIHEEILTVILLPEEGFLPIIAPRSMQIPLPQDGGQITVSTNLYFPAALREGRVPVNLGTLAGPMQDALRANRPVLVIRQEAVLRPTIYATPTYPDLLDIQRRLNHPLARTILLRQDKTGHEKPTE